MQAHSYDAANDAANDPDTGANGANGITGQESMGHKTAIRTGASSGGSIIALRQAVEERTRRARRMRYALMTGRIIADGVLLVTSFIVE